MICKISLDTYTQLVYNTPMDLTSRPLSPWTMSSRENTESRIALAKSADALRREGEGGKRGKLLLAEKLYREAAKKADQFAAVHFIRMADHYRQIHDKLKKAKARKAARKGAR